MTFAFLDDFDITASGTLREASPTESIIQDVGHMLDELGVLGEPTTQELMDEARAQTLTLLGEHPNVRSIEGVEVTPRTDGTNGLTLAIFVNGSPDPLTVNSGG